MESLTVCLTWQVKPLFRHFRRIDSCLQTRVAFRGSDESECFGGSEGVSGPRVPSMGFPSVSEPVLFTASFLEANPFQIAVGWGTEVLSRGLC